ncbi:MAG: hypothetical protein PHQ74_11955 [Crocinitomicaceae bacterium]|nr:hypothetical protein [Crocinitomicaceae bacterium]
MKKTLFLVSALALGVLLPSCSAIKSGTNKSVNANFSPVASQPRYVLYDVDFSTKISGTAYGKTKATDLVARNALIEQATVHAIDNSKSDFIFEPSVAVEIKRRNVTVVVSGYAGKFTGFKDVDVQDSIAFSNYLYLSNKKSTAEQGKGAAIKSKFGKRKNN